MSDNKQRIAELSPQKRALLLQQLSREKSARTRIERRQRPERIATSFGQQRLWLLDQIDPGSANYNVPAAAWMRGTPNLDVLQRAFDELVRRHESLRTTLPAGNGQPRQQINEPYRVTMARHDVSHLPSGERRNAALALGANEVRRPFDLVRGPLMRTLVVTLSEDEHLLVFNFHHSVIDGWSLTNLYRELTALYEAFLHERPSPLAEPALQYADFALWQREWLQGEVLKSQLDYWTERLAGSPPVLELPTDRPRPPVQSYRGDVLRVSVPPEVLAGAQRRSREEGVTLFMTFLAALDVALFRYSGETDIVVGSGIAARNREELEPMIGYFVNTLALRTDVSGNPTFRELLGRVREVTLGAYAHQELPIERLIEELHIERSLSHSPLFQVMAFFQNLPEQSMVLPGMTLVPLHMDDLHSSTARCDLSLFVELNDDRLDILFEYSTDLFEAATVRAFGEHLANLLRAAVAEPDMRISDLPLLGEIERHELLRVRTATQRELPTTTLARLFEEQVARTPDAAAITFAQRTLTYRELNARANAFALELQQRGVRPGQLVGLYADRGLGMVIALLGILKSGAAYLPLDPSYPTDRIAFMLSDTGARLVVTQEHLRDDVPAGNVELIVVDDRVDIEQNAPNVDGGATPNDTAYVIFTSGSTGKPKGVQIPHVGAANFLLAMLREPGLDSSDVVCAITTLSFDISVLELLLPLIVGARAVIGDRATAYDGARLARFVDDSGATVLQATPASWRMLLDAGWKGKPGLKALCGGEALSRDLAETLLTRVAELWNVYGPTETTVWSVLDRITSADMITIGRPIQNMRMYVVDANMQPVPDGVSGELMIGGVGLGHGYVNRPGLTADRFIPDPFGETPGARLYRTGDVARWRRDGRLEILGRSDNQVKVRGFRIELGEIEAALREHRALRQVVVICREDRPGDKRLVAYIVPNDEVPTPNALRAWLRADLPEYMIPSAFVVLERLPISPNGKVDRRALPIPELLSSGSEPSLAPRTPEETQLAQIWAEVLGLEQIGIEDDFFALGGHSLLATQLIARVSRAFGIEVPLRRLFEAPTVAAFAEAILSDQVASMDIDVLANLLQRVEGLSEDEIQSLLAGGSQG